MGVVYDNIDFSERQNILLIKALVAWVKIRFSTAMKLKFDSSELEIVRELQAVDTMKKVGLISDDDAWLIEQNSLLFSIIARMYLNEFLSNELFLKYGDCRFNVSRKHSIADITLLPVTLGRAVAEVVPSTMYIVKRSDIIERFEENKNYYTSKDVDLVPALKSKLSKLLTKHEHESIVKYYQDYKNDPDVVQSNKLIRERREIEDNNLKSVLRAINAQGKRTDLLKLVVCIHTIIKSTYTNYTGPRNIAKIIFGERDNSIVHDYSMLFSVEYDTDLEEVKSILQQVIDPELKLKVGNGKLLCTTATGLNPDDEEEMATISTTKFVSPKGLDHVFETYVGPLASIDDVNRIMDKYLQQRYQR